MKEANLALCRKQFLEDTSAGCFITEMQAKIPSHYCKFKDLSYPADWEIFGFGILRSKTNFFHVEGQSIMSLNDDKTEIAHFLWTQPLIFNTVKDNVEIGGDKFRCSGILGLVYSSESDTFLMLPAKEPGTGDQVILRPIQTSVTRLKHTMEGLATGDPILKKVLEVVPFDKAVCVPAVSADPSRIVSKNLAMFFVTRQEIEVDGAVWVSKDEVYELCLYGLTNSFMAPLMFQFKALDRQGFI
jgi:hypothetical protein